MINSRDIYKSSNGDCWTLVRIGERIMVRHWANEPSGGAITDADLLDFLRTSGLGPEKQSLVRLIGTLVDGQAEPEGQARARIVPPSSAHAG